MDNVDHCCNAVDCGNKVTESDHDRHQPLWLVEQLHSHDEEAPFTCIYYHNVYSGSKVLKLYDLI